MQNILLATKVPTQMNVQTEKSMFSSYKFQTAVVFFLVFFVPISGMSSGRIIDDGSSASAWALFDRQSEKSARNAAKPIHRAVFDNVFNSDAIEFDGRGRVRSWVNDVSIVDPVIKMDIRTSVPNQDFEVVFYVKVADGNRRIARYTTSKQNNSGSSSDSFPLPFNLTDTNAHTILFNVENDLLVGGLNFEEIYQIRVRSAGAVISEISSIVGDDSIFLPPLLTFDQVTGDDTIDDAEDDRAIEITGNTSEIEDGQTIHLTIENEDYTTTAQNNRFSFLIPSDHIQLWPTNTTLTANAENLGGLQVTTSHQIQRGQPNALTSISTDSDGMANLSDRLELDVRGLKAFPGAEGGGQDSNGGRGGNVYIINTRDCSTQAGDGKVSVREVMEATGDVVAGNRVGVFSVGGLFDCGESASLRVEGELTLACQTAPYPGVNMAAYRIEYKRISNVIIRGCQFLNHDYNGNTAGMLKVVNSGDSSDLIFDRLNFLYNVDDLALAFINPNSDGEIHRVTLSNSIIAESDAYSTHEESMPSSRNPNRYVHSHGASCQTNSRGRAITDCSVIGNLFAHTARRNPKFTGASGEIIGNYLYNNQETGPQVIHQNASDIDVYVMDNTIKFGPNTKDPINQDGLILTLKSNSRLKMARNRRILQNGTVIAYDDIDNGPRQPLLTTNTMFDFDCDGAKYRDENVNRILSEVDSGTGEVGIGTYLDPLKNDGDNGRHFVNNPNYYENSQWPSNYDTDRDGISDAWEIANGLTVGVQDNNGDLDNDGYTNIEEFINARIRCGA